MRICLSFFYIILLLFLPVLAKVHLDHQYEDEIVLKNDVNTKLQRQSISFIVKPYIQNPTQTSMSVMWEYGNNQSAEVRYGTSESLLDNSVTVKSEDIVFTSQGTYIYTARINNLEPNTRYWYEIKLGTNISKKTEYNFKTAPEKNGPFRLMVWGDNRSYPSRHRNVANAMASKNGDLAINAGDVVSTGSVYSQWKQQYFDPAADLLCKTPSLIAIGNHEYNDNWFYTYVDHPKTEAAPKKENFFSLTYGPVFIIVLDNNKGWGTNTDPCTPGSAQYNWLITQLESNEAMEANWIMVFHHCPPYTNGWDSDGYTGDMDTRNYLMPLYEQYGVDLVIAGHTHDYERGIMNDVHYIITGGGGSGLDHLVNDFQHIHIYESKYHYIQMDISKNNIIYEVFDTLGNKIDDTLFTKGAYETLNNVSLSNDTLTPGDIATISWNTTNTNGNAEIRLYSDNRSYTIIDNVNITSEQYNWSIPSDLSKGKYSIKIKQDYLESTSDDFIVDGSVALINFADNSKFKLNIINLNNKSIRLTIPSSYKTSIDLYNLNGKRVYSEVKKFSKGNNIISLPKNIFSNGVLLAKVTFGDRNLKKRLLLH